MLSRMTLVLSLSVLSLLVTGCPSSSEVTSGAAALVRQAQEGTVIPGTDFSSIPNELISMMKDQGVMDRFLAKARLHGLNPGLKVSMGVEKWTKIGLDGVDLDAEADVSGTGTQLPTGVREGLLDVLKDLEGRTDDASNTLRDQVLAILGWNRVTSDHNPVPDRE